MQAKEMLFSRTPKSPCKVKFMRFSILALAVTLFMVLPYKVAEKFHSAGITKSSSCNQKCMHFLFLCCAQNKSEK
jgi:hypothetical protein